MRIGLLGASKIAVDCVIKPAAIMPQVQITGVAARDMKRAQAYADENGIAKAHASYDALLSSDDIDLVYIALPVSHHAHWSIKALKAGKHVLCEKPFAMNLEEAKQVLAVATQCGKRIIEAFHYRYHPAFQTCIDWIVSGKIGEIQSIDTTFSAPIPDNGTDIRFRPELGGGAMMDLGCYTINWLQAILGKTPQSISASGVLGDSGVDEKITAHLVFPGDVRASLTTQIGANAPLAVSLQIHGSKGEIKFMNPLAPQMGAMLQSIVGEKHHQAAISPISSYAYQLGAVIDALRSGTSLHNEGDSVLGQQKLLEDVYIAAGFKELRHSTYP